MGRHQRVTSNIFEELSTELINGTGDRRVIYIGAIKTFYRKWGSTRRGPVSDESAKHSRMGAATPREGDSKGSHMQDKLARVM